MYCPICGRAIEGYSRVPEILIPAYPRCPGCKRRVPPDLDRLASAYEWAAERAFLSALVLPSVFEPDRKVAPT